MDGLPEDLQAMLDRDGIRQCLDRLARGEDRRDSAMMRASFWPDATTDFGIFQGNFDAYLAWVVPGSPAIADTQHFLGQSFIDLDGEEARVETHVISYHRMDMGAGNRDVSLGGRYLDRMEKRGGKQWRVAARIMLYDWCQDWGASANWSNGILGTPFSAEHFSGRSKNDYSERFFE